MRQRLIIATRASPLALWQAEHVQKLLQDAHPQLTIELLRLSTRGDQVLDRSLAKIGGKGLFVKELEVALADGRADLAVHSFKDVPMQLEPSFQIGAVLEREDPRDCLVLALSARFGSLEELPSGGRVGTSSLRRELAVRMHYPALQIAAVRGNVGTRLTKLDRGEFDALIMAAAGLKRLGLADRIRGILPTSKFLPAPAQGALAIEIRARDAETAGLIRHLDHAPTRAATSAERMVSRALGGSCQVPLAAYAEVQSGELHLRACAGNVAQARAVTAQASGSFDQAEALGRAVVEQMKAQGVERLLAAASEAG
jgi:hydroxymethylbilane synthase